MARKTKAAKAEPQVDVGAEIFASLRELEKIKGIPVDYMVERLKQALANAYRKDREDHKDVPADNVVVDLDEHGLSMHLIKTAVEEPEDIALEIQIDAARRYNPNVQVGDPVNIPVDIAKFGRIAAQTAKQVVIQGIREAERGVMYEAYSNKSQELLTATVSRIDPLTGDVFVKIGQGGDATEAVLRSSEQIPGESYAPGEMIRVYVLEVHKAGRGPQVQVSRTHPNLVRRLFELETPEIADGQVEIRNIAREAGSRSKMAVRAAMEGIDPVGACVGPKGSRVRAVVGELRGERVDVILWDADPAVYVANALSPAKVTRVLIDEEKAYAGVIARHYGTLGYGPARVKQELHRRGIPKELWDGALAQLPPAQDTIRALAHAKLRGKSLDADTSRRLAAYLQRRGFSWNDIRPVLNELGQDIDEE